MGAIAALARSLLLASAMAAALFAMLAIASWALPLNERETVAAGYTHSGEFAYDAAVTPNAVYPDGRIETGQTAFRKLVDRLHVAFDYRLTSARQSSIRGAIGLDAVISTDNGWRRTLLLASPERFTGASAHVEGMLDLRRLQALARRLRRLTGSSATTLSVALRPRVEVAGNVGRTVVDSTFAPALALVYDGLALRVGRNGSDAAARVSPRKDVPVTTLVATEIGVGELALLTSDARVISVVGIGAALLLVALSSLLLGGLLAGSEGERIAARLGGRVIDARATVPEGRWMSDVQDVDSLRRIAEHFDRIVLHTVEAGTDVYLVDDGVAVYRYRAGGETAAAPELSAAVET